MITKPSYSFMRAFFVWGRRKKRLTTKKNPLNKRSRGQQSNKHKECVKYITEILFVIKFSKKI